MAFQIFRRASGDAAAQKARAGDSGAQTQPNDASLGHYKPPRCFLPTNKSNLLRKRCKKRWLLKMPK
jgi:hypothetical protein